MPENIVLVKRVLGDQIIVGVAEKGGVNGLMMNYDTFYKIFRINPFEAFVDREEFFAKISLEPVNANPPSEQPA